VERGLFESAITPIIRIEPKRLLRYAGRKLASLRDCSSCEGKFLVRERGLTAENLAIYLRMVRILSRNRTKDYCYGSDEQERHSYASCPSLPRASAVRSFTRLS